MVVHYALTSVEMQYFLPCPPSMILFPCLVQSVDNVPHSASYLVHFTESISNTFFSVSFYPVANVFI